MDLTTSVEEILSAFAPTAATPDRLREFRWKLMVLFASQGMDYHSFATMLTEQTVVNNSPCKSEGGAGHPSNPSPPSPKILR
jgi:hypothetical protein